MALTGVFFVFIFLPAVIVLYRLTPENFRNLLLLLLSVFFIAWGSPADVLLIALSTLFNYFTALELDGLRRGRKDTFRKAVLASGVAVNVALLVFYKYFLFFMNSLGGLFGADWNFNVPAAPIGISFFTFSAVSCLCDVSKGDESALRNPLDFALYISFFGKITSGPIVKFREMAGQIRERSMRAESLERGLKLFLIGLSKKLIIAGSLGRLFDAVRAEELGSLSSLTAWLGAVCYSLMLYYDFSGYSDMAIGLGRVFGFDFSKNFDHPYCSRSMTEFWRRWHISLGGWFRDYVYIPLGGSRVGKARNIFNLSAVWVLTGLWHGANWTFVIWGLYHLALLLLEKFALKDLLGKIPAFCRAVMTFLLAVIGWTIFFSDNMACAARYLLRMAGIGGGGWIDRTGLFYLSGGGILLAVALFGATPVLSNLGKRISQKDNMLVQIITTVFFALLLLGSTAFMISDTVSTFLYAKF
ncbi:MAG: MBOAT family protein [Clostridia bacterium]|nr:MBOAT family protein [Clostridia bacterium]